MTLRFAGSVLALGLLTLCPALADSDAGPDKVPVPQDFQPCGPSDPVIRVETRLAAKIGTTFLGCFRSKRETLLPRVGRPALVLFDHAFAMALPGSSHTPADVDTALSTVKKQWAGFNPLSTEHQKYIAWIHEFMQRNMSGSTHDWVIVNPILVSIDRPDRNHYLVTSIRSYKFEDGGEQLDLPTIDSNSVLLRGSELVSLTITRISRDPTDVDQTRAAMAAWARAAAVTAVPQRQ